jgi:hypothetical protein
MLARRFGMLVEVFLVFLMPSRQIVGLLNCRDILFACLRCLQKLHFLYRYVQGAPETSDGF